MLKTFYIQKNEENIIADIIEYPYQDYVEVQINTPLPPNIMSGCYKLLNGELIYIPNLDEDELVNKISILTEENDKLKAESYGYMVTQNRLQLSSTYQADSVTFKVDFVKGVSARGYNEDLYNLILNNIKVGKENYEYDKMFALIMDYTSWDQISWEQFDILVGMMDEQNIPPAVETLVI